MSNQANAATQEVAQTPSVPTQYTISPKTAMFLDLQKKSDKLCSDIIDAIEVYYGASQVDELFDKDFYPIMDSLQNAIFKYVKYSIQNNMGNMI